MSESEEGKDEDDLWMYQTFENKNKVKQPTNLEEDDLDILNDSDDKEFNIMNEMEVEPTIIQDYKDT